MSRPSNRPADGRPRVLVVGQDYPWPPVTGSLIRLEKVIEALARDADVDLFCLVHEDRDDPCELPAHVPVGRLRTVMYRERRFTPARRLRWVLSTQPLRLATTDYRLAREEFAGWANARYDLVWFSKASTYEVLGRPRLGPSIVDLDDLEGRKILARVAVPGPEGSNRVRHALARAQARLDAMRWRRLEWSIARQVSAVTVCSTLDANRFEGPGDATVAVLPNGYDLPETPSGRVSVSKPPTFLLAGLLYYPPNADAARWLVESVLPRLRSEVPDARVRLVGKADPAVTRLHEPPGVTVVGPVPAMLPELARADVVVVPVRFGSGTRVKILEAFAHRIPVVSTTLGAEGLDVEHERHLLLADSPEEFAAACARLLHDQGLRRRLVDAAATHHLERFLWAHAQDKVADLAARHRARNPVVTR